MAIGSGTKSTEKPKDSTPNKKEKSLKSKFVALFHKTKSEPKPSGTQDKKQDPKPVPPTPVSLDRVRGLKASLGKAGASVPAPIETALKQGTTALQQAVQEAEAFGDAVTLYLEARATARNHIDQMAKHVHGGQQALLNGSKALEQRLLTDDLLWKATANGNAALELARKLADHVNAETRQQAELASRLAEVHKPLIKAERDLRNVNGIDNQALNGLRDQIVACRKTFNEASQADQLKDAAELLAKWGELFKEATKDLGELKKLLSSYAQRRKKVADAIEKAAALHGGTTDKDLVELLNKAREALKQADEKMQTVTEENCEEARKLLADHEGLLEAAKKLALKVKQQSELDLKALPEYTRRLEALKKAREQVGGMAGAEAQCKALDELLASVQLGLDKLGFAKLLELMKGQPEGLLEQANKASKEFIEKLDSEQGFGAVRRQAEEALKAYAERHPSALVLVQREALAKALSGVDPLVQTNGLIEAWAQSCDQQNQALKLAETERDKLKLALEDLEKLGPPQSGMQALRDELSSTERLMQGHEYGRARELAERATETTTQFALDFSEWVKARKELELDEMPQRLVPLQSWPPLRGESLRVLQDIQYTLKAVADGEEIQSAIAAARRLHKRAEELLEQARTQGLVSGTSAEGLNFDGLNKASLKLLEVKAKWEKDLELTVNALATLTQKLKEEGVQSAGLDTPLHQQLKALQQRWQPALADLEPAEGKTVDGALTLVLNQFLMESKTIRERALDTRQFERLKDEALQGDELDALRQMQANMTLQVQKLQSLNAPVADFWRLLKLDITPQNAEYLKKKWDQLQKALDLTLEKRTESLMQSRQKGLDLTGEMDKRLNELFDTQRRELPGFYEHLTARNEDAKALIKSGDPTLVLEGIKEATRLRELVDQGSKGGTNKDGGKLKTYKDVAKLWELLSETVGKEVLVKRRPGTQLKLRSELQKAVQKARTLPPDEGWKVLDSQREGIVEAVDQAEWIDQRLKVFEERKTLVVEKLAELHKRAGTAGKTAAFDTQFNSRLEQAEGLARQEGQLDAGFQALQVLHDEVQGLLDSPETARSQLLEKDAEVAQAQRTLRDMARRWQATREYWDETLLPQVKKALDDRGEKGSTEHADLKASVKRAGLPLKGYLDVIAKSPLKKRKANTTPDMGQATQAFNAAHARLRQLHTTARRLIDGGGTTNVELAKDLQSVEVEWVQRVQRADAAFKNLAGALRGLPSVEKDPQNGYEPTLLAGLEKVAKDVESLGARFPLTAFSQPLGVLASPDSTPPQRKQAREEGLRTMRRLRDDVVESPLLQQLVDGANRNLLDVSVNAELGLLRASLKKIELALLVAV